MVSALTNLGLSFLAGLFAPLAAVCVLPLYPGFLAYLAGQVSQKGSAESKYTFIKLGLIVTLGVMSSLFLFGLIFTALLQESLTKAIGVVSPIAFGILGLVSILLIFDVDFGRFFPKVHSPVLKSPYLSSFLFGFFFGAIVLPCNPAALLLLFAISTSVTSFVLNLLNFIFFGIGMAAPLLVFAIVSAAWSKKVISFLITYKSWINRTAGVIMLVITLYYLIFVFRVLG